MENNNNENINNSNTFDNVKNAGETLKSQKFGAAFVNLGKKVGQAAIDSGKNKFNAFKENRQFNKDLANDIKQRDKILRIEAQEKAKKDFNAFREKAIDFRKTNIQDRENAKFDKQRAKLLDIRTNKEKFVDGLSNLGNIAGKVGNDLSKITTGIGGSVKTLSSQKFLNTDNISKFTQGTGNNINNIQRFTQGSGGSPIPQTQGIGQIPMTSNGGIDFNNLMRTSAEKRNKNGKAGRPRSKAVIKSRALFSIGGTQSDFEKLLTLEDMTEGKSPISFSPQGSSGQTPMPGLSSNSPDFASNISRLTQNNQPQQDRVQQLQQFTNTSNTGGVQQLQPFIQSSQSSQNNLSTISKFAGTNNISVQGARARDKLRRFL